VDDEQADGGQDGEEAQAGQLDEDVEVKPPPQLPQSAVVRRRPHAAFAEAVLALPRFLHTMNVSLGHGITPSHNARVSDGKDCFRFANVARPETSPPPGWTAAKMLRSGCGLFLA
jgi:hypothetical protein